MISQSPATQSKQGKNFSQRFFFFVLLLLLSIGAIITLILSITVKDVIERTAENGIVLSLDKNEAAIQRFLDTHIAILEDISESAILIQAAMQPNNHIGAASDFMENIKVLRNKYRMTLLSFDQQFLYPNISDPYKFYTTNEQIKQALSQSKSQFFIHKRNDSIHWVIATPIMYIGHSEGVLLTEIPLQHIEPYLHSDNDFSDEHLEILINGNTALSLGKTFPEVINKVKQLPGHNITLSSSINKLNVNNAINQVLIYFWVIFIVITAICLFLSYSLGNIYLIQPLEFARNQAEILRQELEETVRELEISNEELVQFSYRTSHDLKAPLTASKRLAGFIVQDIEDQELPEAINNTILIQKQMAKLETLVTDILSLSRADSDSINKEPIDFNELIQDIKERLSWMIEDSGCAITTDINIHSKVTLEKVRLVQVVENLISNSIKYRNSKEPQPYTKVLITEQEDHLIVTISDNGLGIPEEKHADVFKMFHRFHPQVINGSGLGLSIVKRHVDKLNGNIQFTSSGKGTIFKIDIPIDRSNNE